MPRTTKARSSRFTLPPLERHQRQTLEFQPIAEALVDLVVRTMCGIGDPFTVDDAMDALYARMMATSHAPKAGDDDNDEVIGRRMSAHQDSALMIGFALGRRIGGAR